MKKATIIAATIASALISGTAFAATGPYVQGQVGYSNSNVADSAVNATSTSDEHIAGRISVGYVLLEKDKWDMGTELGWGSYGNTTATDSKGGSEKASTTATDIDLVASYHINQKVSLITKGGLAYERLNDNYADETNSSVKPLLGIGIGYNLSSHVQANLSYDHIFGDSSNTSGGVPTLDTVFAGVKYSFK